MATVDLIAHFSSSRLTLFYTDYISRMNTLNQNLSLILRHPLNRIRTNQDAHLQLERIQAVATSFLVDTFGRIE